MFKPKNISNIIGGGLLGACLLLAGPIPTQAEVIINATEIDGDVVFEYSGTLLTGAWTFQKTTTVITAITPSAQNFVVGPAGVPQVDNYVGPINYLPLPAGGFGPGSSSFPDSGSGDVLGIEENQLKVPPGFTSGGALSGSSTYAGETFASLGLEIGSYTWSFGQGIDQKDSITLNIMGPPPPTVSFAADVTQGFAPLTVQFTNASIDATTYLWIFGNSATSTAENPSHTYSTPGTYTVSLVAAGAGGTNSLTRTDYIVVSDASDAPTVEVEVHPGVAVVNGTVGEHYQVEWRDALVEEGPWQLLEDIPSLPSSPYVVYDPAPFSETSQRFYRAVLVP